jgi:DNA-directed RNA polymerase specialized sigma24 family protein
MSNFNINAEWEIYYPKVYGYFFRRLNNRLDVEDLTSLVLSQFFQTLLDQEKASRILNQNAYLWKIARNQLATFIDTKVIPY